MLVSAQALILALFGGVGSLWGPVIGAAVLVPLAEGLNAELGDVLPGIQGVVYGVAIIAIILLAPEGVYWRVRDRLSRRRSAAAAPRAAAHRCRTGRGRCDRAADPTRRDRRRTADLLVLRDCRHLVRRAARARRVDLDRARGRAVRHHRPERRRQDDAVQRHQRLSDARSRHDQLRRRADHRAAPEPGLPARHRPHVSGRARLSAHDRARKRRSSAPLSARATTPTARRMAAGGARPGRARPTRRRARPAG